MPIVLPIQDNKSRGQIWYLNCGIIQASDSKIPNGERTSTLFIMLHAPNNINCTGTMIQNYSIQCGLHRNVYQVNLIKLGKTYSN